jgi:uncharacterized protein (TIGR01777 family)
MTTPILILGATGFIGRHLVADLLRDNHQVIALSRDPARARRLLGPTPQLVQNLETLAANTRIAAIVNLAGAPVIGMPWTDARRHQLITSRTGPAAAALALVRRLEEKPKVLVAASAVGFYGATPGASFDPRDESAPPRPGEFQSDLCVAVENEALAAASLGLRVVLARFAVVMGRDGGAYPMLTPAARLGMGAVLGSGLQPAPWVHIDDVVGLLRLALADETLSGPMNVVAPETPTNADFTKALAVSFGRKARLRLPAAPLRWLGGEMAGLLLDGQNAVPTRALAAGYRFRFPGLAAALTDLARRTPS